MFRPIRDRKFGVIGELTWSGSGTEQVIKYWYHIPYFWRVERNGEVELIAGREYQSGQVADEIECFRMFAMPAIFAHKFGLRVPEGEPIPARHGPTGRPALMTVVEGTQGGSLVVDIETHMVLSLNDGNQLNIETRDFQVCNSMEASIFGEETLETPGFYHGYLESNQSSPR